MGEMAPSPTLDRGTRGRALLDVASAGLASCFLVIQGACLGARWDHWLGLSHRLWAFCLTSGTPRSKAGHEPNHI